MHGCTVDQACVELDLFLTDASRNGYERVRVITGKGVNSSDGVARIKPAVKQYLQEKQYTFTTAKMTEGGEGAIIVKI